jgi:hypothetical protein
MGYAALRGDQVREDVAGIETLFAASSERRERSIAR